MTRFYSFLFLLALLLPAPAIAMVQQDRQESYSPAVFPAVFNGGGLPEGALLAQSTPKPPEGGGEPKEEADGEDEDC